jgi:cellobiose phosphorylase
MFGIRPTGMRSFNITPSMPTAWPEMSLKKMRAFGTALDITVKRAGKGKLEVVVTPEGKASKTFRIKEGATAKVDLLNL